MDFATLEALVVRAVHFLEVEAQRVVNKRSYKISRTIAVHGLGSHIMAVRQGVGLTRIQVARMAGIATETLKLIESGQTANPDILHVVAIAHALQVPLMLCWRMTTDAQRRCRFDAAWR